MIISVKEQWMEYLKGGPGSGSWNAPGSPRFAFNGKTKDECIKLFKENFNIDQVILSSKIEEIYGNIFHNKYGNEIILTGISNRIMEDLDYAKKKFPLMNNVKLKVLTILPKAHYADGTTKEGLTGCYNPKEKQVSIGVMDKDQKKFRTLDRISNTAIHEMAHHAYYTNTDVAGKFDKIYSSLSKSVIQSKISSYAGTNRKEGFAESVVRFCHKEYKGDLPEQIHNFLKGFGGDK